jgi:hypothetical protein
MPNAELAYRVLDHIDAHPESWDQTQWVCGTTACFAGWALRLSGYELEEGSFRWSAEVADGPLAGVRVEYAACDVLKIESPEICRADGKWDGLFNEGNDRAKLGELVKEIFGPRPDHM